jgi:putative transposase
MNYHRRSIRLPAYDYSREGTYYVTSCAQDRACLFGDVANGEMVLNQRERVVQQCWDDLMRHYNGIELDAFVIMPNHVHGIVVITGDVMAVKSGVVVGAGLKPAPTAIKRHGLPEIIRAFKTFSARKINVMRNTPGKPVW